MSEGRKYGRKPSEDMMDAQTKLDVGNRLRMIREAQGLSQNAFAKVIGFSQSTVNTTEAGFVNKPRVQPSKTYIYKVCKECNANAEWVLTGEGEMFLEKHDSELELITKAMHGESEIKKRMMLTLASMPDELIEKVISYWVASK